MAQKGNKGKRDTKGKTSTQNTKQSNTKEERRRERPVGITGIMGKWNRLKESKLLYHAQSIYINQYMTEGSIGMGINGLDGISRFLRIGKKDLMKRLSEATTAILGIGTHEEQLNGINRVVISQLINMALADRSLITEQVHNLKRAQGAGYVPFLTTSYNQALKLGIESQKPFLELLKALNPVPGPNTNILIQGDPKHNNVPDANSVSTHEAMKLIDAARNGTTLLEDESSKLELYSAYVKDTSLPEVVATKQLGEAAIDGPLPSKKKRHTERNEATGPITEFVVLPQ